MRGRNLEDIHFINTAELLFNKSCGSSNKKLKNYRNIEILLNRNSVS